MFEGVFPFALNMSKKVASILLDAMPPEKMTQKPRLYDREMTVPALLRKLDQEPFFDLDISGTLVSWGGVKNYDLTLLRIENGETETIQTVVSKLHETIPLTMARLFDKDYEHWENAEDPLEYQVAGKTLDGLALKSNGLPFPLTQEVVDVSRNPGRRILQKGYVEAVGHHFWLGPVFFERVSGVSKQDILSADWLTTTPHANELLEVAIQSKPFANRSNQSLQDKVRQFLFPI